MIADPPPKTYDYLVNEVLWTRSRVDLLARDMLWVKLLVGVTLGAVVTFKFW